MSQFTPSGRISLVGNANDPDIIYYNASIVNNTTNDVGLGNIAVLDPPITFNETRDTAIIKDCSRYNFSIIRFVVNGGNKDLPLFIPSVQSSTGQTNVNLTSYAVALSYSGLKADGVTPLNIVSYGNYENDNTTPGFTYVIYVPETQNPILAPIPRTTASINYVNVWDGAYQYVKDNIVYVVSQNQYYQANIPSVGQDPTLKTYTTVGGNTVYYWKTVSDSLGNPQDVSSRYYWVYSYTHWLSLIQDALEVANSNLYQNYVDSGGDPTVYASYSTTAPMWITTNPTPVITYNNTTQLFSIAYPPSYLSLDQQQSYGYTPTTDAPQLCLYMNQNMFGLFAGFDNTYYNTVDPVYSYGSPSPPHDVALFAINRWAYPSTQKFPVGFANKMIVSIPLVNLGDSKGYTAGPANVVRLVDVDGDVKKQFVVVMTQDYASTSTLWSPIDSIVFTTALLPVQNEQTAPPNVLGRQNVGNSSATSASAFSPIITDIALDLGNDGTAWRKMLYYSPSAEYRLSDFQNSKADIRSIDIQVFWRNRLDNNLYPVSMFNLSSVSIKVMFRKKLDLAKSEKLGLY